MRASMKDHVRDALLTVALFGGIGVALAQAPKPAAESGAFADGKPTYGIAKGIHSH